MFWIVTWCDYGIGAIFSLIATGDLSERWMLLGVALAMVGGFLRGIQKAREKERTP